MHFLVQELHLELDRTYLLFKQGFLSLRSQLLFSRLLHPGLVVIFYSIKLGRQLLFLIHQSLDLEVEIGKSPGIFLLNSLNLVLKLGDLLLLFYYLSLQLLDLICELLPLCLKVLYLLFERRVFALFYGRDPFLELSNLRLLGLEQLFFQSEFMAQACLFALGIRLKLPNLVLQLFDLLFLLSLLVSVLIVEFLFEVLEHLLALRLFLVQSLLQGLLL